MNIKNLEEIVRDSFGLWVSAIFSAIGSWNPDLSFEQRKDAFFLLTRHLLETGKIKFVKPGADCYISPDNPHPQLSIEDEAAHWELSAVEIVSYLKNAWPEGITSENDAELTLYFYDIPAVIWVAENGQLVAS